MPEHDAWAFDLATRGGATLGALEVEEATIVRRLMGASEARVTVRGDALGANLLEVGSVILRAHRRPPSSSALTARTCRFAGEIHEPLIDQGDVHGEESVEVLAKDPWAALAERRIPWNYSSGPWALNLMFADLVGILSIIAEDPAGTDATYPTGMGVVATAGAWPTLTRAWDRLAPAEEALRELWEAEQGVGFWWDVRPVYPPTSNSWAAMHIRLTSGTAKTARLEYGPGTVANLSGYRVERRRPLNVAYLTGANGLSWHIVSESAATTYGVWPVSGSYLDVDTTARLDQLARGLWTVAPTDLIQVDVAYPNPAGSGLGESGLPAVPALWDDFDVGDTLPVFIRGARRSVSATAMVREATVQVNAEGAERLSSLTLEVTA